MTTNNPLTLTAGEAARLLGLAQSTLAKLRLSGNGPVYCKLGRRVVYRSEDLFEWLKSRLARDTSDADARLPKSLTGGSGAKDGLPPSQAEGEARRQHRSPADASVA